MSWLNIVGRELRVGARRNGLYRTRYGSACAAVAIVVWFLIVPAFNSPQEFSNALFSTLSVAAYFSAGLAGFSITADCLSEERRDGTLGLLFLTELRGIDIIAGKLAATSLHVIYGLIAFVPVLAIAILAGGVSGTEFSRVVLAAFNLLFLSLSIGMFTSVLCRSGTHSMSAAFALFAFLLAGVPLGAGFLDSYHYISDETAALLCLPCPGTACVLGFSGASSGPKEVRLFYQSLLCVHLIGWACLIFAVLRVNRSWQDVPLAPKESGWRRWWFGTCEVRERFRHRWLDMNPYLWRSSRHPRKPLIVWIVIGIALAIYLWGALKYPQNYLEPASMIFMTFLMHTLLKLWVTIETPHAISEDKQNGALELLLVTPLSESDIVQGQYKALYRQFLGPTIMVLAIDLAFLIYSSADMSTRSDSWTRALLIAGMVGLVADLPTLARYCLAQAVRLKGENRAVISTLVLVLAGPWCLQFLILALLSSLSTMGVRSQPFDSEILTLGLWLSLTALADGFAWWRASKTLPARLRTLAAGRFDSTPSPI